MIYIVSGCSRSGKTMIAKRLLAAEGLTYLSLDWLVMGFTGGMPECGIHDLQMPDEIAKGIWRFVRAMLESMIFGEEDCVVEGEAILPELIAEFVDEHPDAVKVCFLGYTEISAREKFEAIKKHSTGDTDWLADKSDAYVIDHVNNMVAHSKLIESACRKHEMKYVETSHDFERAIDEAMAYLIRPAR